MTKFGTITHVRNGRVPKESPALSIQRVWAPAFPNFWDPYIHPHDVIESNQILHGD